MLLDMLEAIEPLPRELEGLGPDLQDDQCRILAQQVDAWFTALQYGEESYEQSGHDYREWIITIPTQQGYDRVLVRCVVRKPGLGQLEDLRQSFAQQQPDKGWLISNHRVVPESMQTLND